MTRSLGTLTALALASGLIAGCGGGGSTTTSSHASSTPAAASSTPGTSSSAKTSPATPVPNLQAAVAACKQTIQAQKTLSAGAKGKLEAVCGKAAEGDTAAVHKAAREVCEEVIETSAVHAGSARDQALAACRTK